MLRLLLGVSGTGKTTYLLRKAEEASQQGKRVFFIVPEQYSFETEKAVTAFLAVFWVEIGVASHIDKMVIGAIMNLVPGVAITNSMRDIIAGDLLAGQAKLVEALFIATAIALGAGMVLSLHRLFF